MPPRAGAPRRSASARRAPAAPPLSPSATADRPDALSRPVSIPGLTVEASAYALLLLCSLLLRLWQIDDMPLSAAEARVAAAALEVPGGTRPPAETGALLWFGTAAVLALAGTTDAAARFLPAVVGGLVPLTLLWARPLVGRTAALIAATTLTVSPLLLDRARALDSAAIAVTISLALVFALFDYARTRHPDRLYAVAVLLALAFTAGAAAFATVVALTAYGGRRLISQARREGVPVELDAAVAKIAPTNGHAQGEPLPEHEEWQAGRARVLPAVALFVGTFLIVSTGALTTPAGIAQGVFAPMAARLNGVVSAPSQGLSPAGPLTLLAYEPLVAALGLVGAVMALRGGGGFDRFLVWWLVVALVAAFAAPRADSSLLGMAVAPAAILSATVVSRLIARVSSVGWGPFAVALAVLVWGTSVVVMGFGQVSLADPIGIRYVAAFLAPVTAEPSSTATARWLVALLPVVLFAGAVAYLWPRLGSRSRPALGLAASCVLLAFTVHAGWNLAYQVVDNVAELPRSRQTSVDVRALSEDVHVVQQVLTINRKDKTFFIHESLRYPLTWYLNHRREAPPEVGPVAPGSPAIVVLPVDAEAPAGRYTGQRYRLASSGDVTFENLAEFWRWLLYREHPTSIESEDVVLFVRAQ